MADLTSKTLNDRYQIADALGEGGMGSVYKAYDPNLQRAVAVKVMHRRLQNKGAFEDRFVQEARTIAKLSHPGIVQVFDFGQAGTLLYIVMEFIPGENLEQMIRHLRSKRQWITLAEAIALIRQIAQALDYAHRQKVFHRDIKPANIMLKAEAQDRLPYRPVITDLGLAKLAEGGLETQIGLTMGTPAYMSPEQALGGDVDARSDIYSLGILLYELTVGQLPFPIKGMTEALRYHVHEEPPAPRSLYPTLPATIEAIILQALAKAPDQRYATAGEFAQALLALPAEMLTDTIPPTAIAGAGTLLTQWQESLLVLHGESIVPQPIQPNGQKLQIVVRTPDNQEHPVGLAGTRLTIGRHAANLLPLDDQRASRYHAVLTYEGNQVWVTDLGSTNGTFLGKEQLPANVRTRWDGKVPLRIGSHHLILQAIQEPPIVAAAAATTYEPPKFKAAPATGSLVVSTPTVDVTATPGQGSQLSFTVQNQGSEPETVQLGITGIPQPWIVGSLPVLQLAPGMRQTASLIIQPPRTAQTQPGHYTLQLLAGSQRVPNQRVNTQVLLTVTPYVQFRSILSKQAIGRAEQLQVQVENQGNVPQTFQLAFSDDGQALTFTPPQLTLQVANGQSATAQAQVKPVRRALGGRPKAHTVHVRVTAPGGLAETHYTTYVSRPLIPVGLSLFLLLLFGAMLGGAWWVAAQLPDFARDQTAGGTPSIVMSITVDSAPIANVPSEEVVAQGVVTDARAVSSASETVVVVSASPTQALPSTPTPALALAATETAIALRLAAVQATQTAIVGDLLTREANATATAAQVAREMAATLEQQRVASEATRIQQESAAEAARQQALRAAAALAATAAAIPTPIPPPPTLTPTPAPPVRPDLVTGFEVFGQWTRGIEPWGTFVQSSEQKVADTFAAKLAYDFSSAQTSDDYVVFLGRPALAIPGQPKGVCMQVFGDGSGNFLNMWVQDGAGAKWAFSFGKINHQGWQALSAPFDPNLGWPNGLLPDSSKAEQPTYPLSLYAFVLDGEPRQLLTGAIYLDELIATDAPGHPILGGSQPSGGGATTPADPNITCSVAPSAITAGQTATLSWNISGVKEIYFEGRDATGTQQLPVNPTQTTNYTLRVVRVDGSETTCVMTVQVN